MPSLQMLRGAVKLSRGAARTYHSVTIPPFVMRDIEHAYYQHLDRVGRPDNSSAFYKDLPLQIENASITKIPSLLPKVEKTILEHLDDIVPIEIKEELTATYQLARQVNTPLLVNMDSGRAIKIYEGTNLRYASSSAKWQEITLKQILMEYCAKQFGLVGWQEKDPTNGELNSNVLMQHVDGSRRLPFHTDFGPLVKEAPVFDAIAGLYNPGNTGTSYLTVEKILDSFPSDKIELLKKTIFSYAFPYVVRESIGKTEWFFSDRFSILYQTKEGKLGINFDEDNRGLACHIPSAEASGEDPQIVRNVIAEFASHIRNKKNYEEVPVTSHSISFISNVAGLHGKPEAKDTKSLAVPRVFIRANFIDQPIEESTKPFTQLSDVTTGISNTTPLRGR